jgi:hypothetical protein
MKVLLALLTAQALLGALDNFWHHEFKERLPARRSAAGELTLHTVREFIYTYVFIQLAWFEPHGMWAVVLAAALAIEVFVTAADFIVEDRTRRLAATERFLHTIMAINFGMILITFVQPLSHWWSQPTGIARVSYGAYSPAFAFFALGAAGFFVRDAIAVLRLRRPAEWVRDPIESRTRSNPKTVLISGATGFIGGHLVRRLVTRGDRVIVLTRDRDRALDRFGPHVRIVTAPTELPNDEPIDAIVNLAGAPILGLPWTSSRRRKLIDSRVNTTRSLVDLCGRLSQPPRVFVSGSAIGYYGLGGSEPFDESAPSQPIFQSNLCQAWEATAQAAEGTGTRVVRIRTGLVLGRDGGALPQLAIPVRLGLGAVLGDGKQWVSWIHIDDLTRLLEFAIDTPTCKGAVNATSPAAATHAQMQRLLAKTLHRPLWMRIPASLVRAGLGEMSQLLVDGQRVAPIKALTAGFVFKHPNLGEALQHLFAAGKTLQADIYYNGECPVCRTEMEHYAEICATTRPELRFIDSTRGPNDFTQCGLRQEHLERRVYIRDANGRIISGMPAIVALWSRMPRYEWAGRLFSLPVIRQATELLYDHVIAPSLALWAKSRARRRTASAH